MLLGTAPAAPEYSVAAADFAALAREFGAAYFCDPAINRPEYVRMAADSGAVVAISVNWPTLLGPAVLGVFEHGVINAHAGDLPRYRGNATPNWAILAGEDKVVLSLHKMVERLDAGPILAQREFPLGPSTYVADVYRFLSVAVPELFGDVLDRLEQATLVSREQPEAAHLSLRCFPRLPRDAELVWGRRGVDLAGLVRASAEPFAGAYTFLGTEKIVVWRAHSEDVGYPYLGVPGQVVAIRHGTGEVAVLTGEGLLVVEEIEAAEIGRGAATARLNSTRHRLGMDMSAELIALSTRLGDLEKIIATRPDQPGQPRG